MGVSRLLDFLSRHRRIGLDTNIFIYELAANARYTPLTEALFRNLEKSGETAVTSTLTMTELLVYPYRVNDRRQILGAYAKASSVPSLEWIPPSLLIADSAARIRATYNLKTVDAIQAATTIHAGATGFVTNDPVFARLPKFETVVLDNLL